MLCWLRRRPEAGQLNLEQSRRGTLFVFLALSSRRRRRRRNKLFNESAELFFSCLLIVYWIA